MGRAGAVRELLAAVDATSSTSARPKVDYLHEIDWYSSRGSPRRQIPNSKWSWPENCPTSAMVARQASRQIPNFGAVGAGEPA